MKEWNLARIALSCPERIVTASASVNWLISWPVISLNY
jgi:hypothetical protein